ncbi:ribosomal RNA small subunit methyltransferase A [Candidatus Nomurabacteria bacterium RIFCSPHIGHO2_01_FULL_38_19]|uniref:Ribosomal RNA small subunit methyltransferase A n=1 Tax=Candidatus Nomurabacteria bacterium RIFCSPHIGHO2_01_FULL_38_19 TaxID=1801732 RepID=A0A1F6UQT1_9BACT|nr:MAG: ribosomal RNA small subunit methyltransferase A [Candidatus Nomurabacteria bacterium RIFCSPHIGHO2_01_FULL_38_19]
MKTSNKNYRAKKSLGQNFLKSNLALKKIIEAGEIKFGDIILEIGPGKGALTEKLLEKVHPAVAGQGFVIAVEKDRELIEILKEKFSEQIKLGSLVLVHDDILELDIKKYSKNSKELRYKIIANIPYNITGAILKKFLTEENQPERMILMVQREVAQRIMGRPRNDGASKKESLLSISVKAYGEPKLVMKVPARYFSPAPKVDSAVIVIKNISRKIFETPPQPSPKGRDKFESSPLKGDTEGLNEEKFWKIVKAGFAHKRKKLVSNLKNVIFHKNAHLKNFGDKRAEDLSLLEWITLIR